MNEELNLNELFSNFVKFNIRNKKLLLTFMAIGLLSVVFFQKFKTPYYETKAICMSGISEYERQDQIEDLSQRTAIDLINYLQINIENKDYQQLADLMGVDVSVAEIVREIEAEQLYQQDMNEKFYALNKFEILLTLYDNDKIGDIQEGLVYYFSNNTYINQYYNQFVISNNQIIKDIEGEIKLLAEVRMEGSKNNMDNSSINFNNSKSGRAISNQIVGLSQLREDIKTKQLLLKPLLFVQDFAKVNKKEDDILVWGILGVVCSFIFGLFLALIIEVKTN